MKQQKFEIWGRKNPIYRIDNFGNLYDDYFLNDEINLSHILNEKRYRSNTEDFSYRIINFWQQKGLLYDNRENSKGWRKFSFIEIIWLHLLSELRRFGVSIKMLIKIKEALYYTHDTVPKSLFPNLEFFTAYTLAIRVPVSIIIFQDGAADILFDSEYSETKLKIGIKNHIRISLNDLCQKALPDQDISAVKSTSISLDQEELELLLILRTGKFDTVQVTFNSGKIKQIDAKQFLDKKNLLSDLKKDADFQSIEFIQTNGKITGIKRTIHHRSKKS